MEHHHATECALVAARALVRTGRLGLDGFILDVPERWRLATLYSAQPKAASPSAALAWTCCDMGLHCWSDWACDTRHALFPSNQFINLPPDAFRPRSVAAVSIGVILPTMIMNAIVAGVAEEAAYRGYMQGMLERYFRATVAVALVTIVFTGLHLLGGTKTLPLAIPVCATSIVLGALTAITQSIIPAIVVHVLADTVTLPFEWGLLGWPPVGRFQTSGIDSLFIAAAAVVILGSVATIAVFLRLHKIVQAKS